MMLNKLLKKHVLLSMNNGTILEGFVDLSDDVFLYLYEQNNQEVIVRIDDISFARIPKQPESQLQMSEPLQMPESQQPYPLEQRQQDRPTYRKSYSAFEDYSMPMPRPTDNPYVKQPEFVKSGDE